MQLVEKTGSPEPGQAVTSRGGLGRPHNLAVLADQGGGFTIRALVDDFAGRALSVGYPSASTSYMPTNSASKKVAAGKRHHPGSRGGDPKDKISMSRRSRMRQNPTSQEVFSTKELLPSCYFCWLVN